MKWYLLTLFFFGKQACGGARLGKETDRIRMESDSDSTFYHIFTRIRIQIRMFSNTIKTDVSNSDTHLDICST
jgi:hypothetical protein